MNAIAAAKYSNVIFFGDSLSDIGNFPMANQVYLYPKSPATVFNLYGMYYIPVSNPVNLLGYKLSIVKLLGLKHKPYVWPSASLYTLPTAPKINGQKRQSRSYSWTEFFVTDAHQDGLLATAKIIPSMLIKNKAITTPITYSVDYAFANATSTMGCNYKGKFQRFGRCSYSQIKAAGHRFITDPTLKNYEHVLVPGLLKQEHMFENDVHEKRIKVGAKTLYSIWIGGNDLLKDLIRLKSPKWSIKLEGLKNISSQLAKNNERAILTLIHSPSIKAKHIMIFGFFNPGKIVPVFHNLNWFEKISAGIIVSHYNRQIKSLVEKLSKEYPKIQIQYEAAPYWYEEMASRKTIFNKVFIQKHMGKACQLADPNYNDAETPKANCKGYLFWNAVHPASSAQQIVGYLAEQSLFRNKQ